MSMRKFRLTPPQLAAVQDLIDNATSPKVRRRADALMRIHNGAPVKHVAEALGVQDKTVYAWLQRFREHGLDGLYDRPRSGRPSKVDASYIASLETILAEVPYDFGIDDAAGWTVPVIQQIMEQQTGITYSATQLRILLHKLGYRYQRAPSLLDELMPPFPTNGKDMLAWLRLQRKLADRLPAAKTHARRTWVKVQPDSDKGGP